MTQEGQALPSPTPPENPPEPSPTSTSTEPPVDTHSDAAREKDDTEEKQEQQIKGGEDDVQEETHREGEESEGVKDEGGEGEMENSESTEEEHQQTKGEEERKDNEDVQQSADEELTNPQQPGRLVHHLYCYTHCIQLRWEQIINKMRKNHFTICVKTCTCIVFFCLFLTGFLKMMLELLLCIYNMLTSNSSLSVVSWHSTGLMCFTHIC